MSATYGELLDYALRARMRVAFTTERGVMVDYSVVLVLGSEDAAETVRLYDGAHGRNEMHRHTRGGAKQTGEVFHAGTLSEGMQIAIDEIERGYAGMVEGWRGR
jgi:hypothetical protein